MRSLCSVNIRITGVLYLRIDVHKLMYMHSNLDDYFNHVMSSWIDKTNYEVIVNFNKTIK